MKEPNKMELEPDTKSFDTQETAQPTLAMILAAGNQVLQRVESIEKRVESIEKRVESIEHRLDRIENRLDRIEYRLDVVERKVEGLERKVEALENKVEGLDHKVDALDHKVDALDRKVAGLEQKYDARFEEMRLLLMSFDVRIDRVEANNYEILSIAKNTRADVKVLREEVFAWAKDVRHLMDVAA